jgi:hypothetical protein
LTFIRTAHYWTVVHPHLPLEDDAQQLLKVNEELTQRLLHDPEAARCDLGQRLFAELEDLRGLNERRELERAKQALEAEVLQTSPQHLFYSFDGTAFWTRTPTRPVQVCKRPGRAHSSKQSILRNPADSPAERECSAGYFL